VTETQRGAAFAVCAYTVWGVNPVYFKWLSSVSPVELLCHRIVWSVVLLAAIVVAMRRGAAVRSVLKHPSQLKWLAVSSVLISINWLVFIWAVQHGRIVETTLGYFINPLLSVLLGVLFFHERIDRLQTVAIAIAAVGVLNEIVQVGVFPWIGLTLALSFGLYGFVRKRVGVEAIIGLGIETSLLAPFALVGLGIMFANGAAAFGTQGATVSSGLIAAGAITSFPLVCFAAAALRLPLSVLGIFQYLSPSLSLAIAVFMFREPFTAANAMTFGCIWSGLVLFTLSAFSTERAVARPESASGS
jgi:chloramphenicol-sensitive protein RarD